MLTPISLDERYWPCACWVMKALPALPAKSSAEGLVGQTQVVKSDPAATEASQGYPDVGLLDMTKEQLMAAPDFHYAPRPDLARYIASDSTARKN